MGVMNVSYLTVNGEILSETRNGVESDYVPDPLGSTVALIGASQTITDTFAWWPYGELRSHSGSSIIPFGYVGTLCYYTDGGTAHLYIRAGTFRQSLTRWESVDLMWPDQFAFVYSMANPVTYSDPTGKAIGPNDLLPWIISPGGMFLASLGGCSKKTPGGDPLKPCPHSSQCDLMCDNYNHTPYTNGTNDAFIGACFLCCGDVYKDATLIDTCAERCLEWHNKPYPPPSGLPSNVSVPPCTCRKK